MDIDTQPQPITDEEQSQDFLIREKALQEIYEAAQTFKGGSQITPETHAQSIVEYRRFREAIAQAHALKITHFSIQLALKGEINPMWID